MAEAIREEVATFLAVDVKDPRVTGLVTVTGCEVTRDLRHAKVFVSIMGTDTERRATLEGLASVATHLRVARRSRAAAAARAGDHVQDRRERRARGAHRGPARADQGRAAAPPMATGDARRPDAGGLLLVDKPAGITSHDVVARRAPRDAVRGASATPARSIRSPPACSSSSSVAARD